MALRIDGKVDETELQNLVGLMDVLKFTDEQKFKMYFMTYDDPYFVEMFLLKCANLPAFHPDVVRYLAMMEYDIEETNTKPVYEKFRREAKYFPRIEDRKHGVIENYSLGIKERSLKQSKKRQIELKETISKLPKKKDKPLKIKIKKKGD